MADIHKAILDIQAEINHIGKDQEASGGSFSYKFRGIDDVMNSIHPLLAKHRVFVTPTVMQEFREERVSGRGGVVSFVRLHVKLTLFAEDGSSVDAIVIGEAMDSSDKASTKSHSIAYRIGLLQILCIPTEETAINVENDNHEVAPAGSPDLYNKIRDAVAVAKSVEQLEKMKGRFSEKRGELDDSEQEKLLSIFFTRKIELEHNLNSIEDLI